MVGELMRRRREELGISQGTLAQRIDRDQSFVSQMERRTTPGYLPDAGLLRDIAAALSLPVSAFLGAAGYLPTNEGQVAPPEPSPLADPLTVCGWLVSGSALPSGASSRRAVPQLTTA